MDKFHQDHPWAFVVRLGIFCPPFFVAAFASFIRPYPEKPHYREVPGRGGFGNELSWDSVILIIWLFGWVRRFSLKRGFDRFWTGNDSGNLGVRKVWFSKSLQDDFHPSKSENKNLMGWDFHIALFCGSIGYFCSGSWSLKIPPHQWATRYLWNSVPSKWEVRGWYCWWKKSCTSWGA